MSFMRFFWVCVTIGAIWGAMGLTKATREVKGRTSIADWIVGALFGAIIGMFAAFMITLAIGFILWLLTFVN